MTEKKSQKASFLDYPTLCDLARSRNIRYAEARGLDLRKGVRFRRDGLEWIAVDADLPVSEKVRVLGYLLESEPTDMATRVGVEGGSPRDGSFSPVLTLCCS